MTNWPSPPRLKTPHLYAKAAHSEVKIRGHALMSVCAIRDLLPTEPENKSAYPLIGFLPKHAMIMAPITSAKIMEITGTSAEIRCSLLVPPKTLNVFLLTRLSSCLACHSKRDFFDRWIIAGINSHNFALKKNNDSVG